MGCRRCVEVTGRGMTDGGRLAVARSAEGAASARLPGEGGAIRAWSRAIEKIVERQRVGEGRQRGGEGREMGASASPRVGDPAPMSPSSQTVSSAGSTRSRPPSIR